MTFITDFGFCFVCPFACFRLKEGQRWSNIYQNGIGPRYIIDNDNTGDKSESAVILACARIRIPS